MATIAQPIPFAGAELDQARHVCAFFNSEEEEYRVLLPFIRGGFECGHKAAHIISPDRCDRHIKHLAAAGIDVAEAQRSGQLELRTNTEVYLRNGRFDQDRMLETFERIASSSVDGPYPLSRIVCQMEWASRHPNCIGDLIEFEARVNEVWCRHDDAVICVYDLARFSGDTIMDVMRTHPMIIVGSILQQNPFFVPPQQFLQELEQRRTEQAFALRSDS
jgi:DcmR-like sensory protein